MSSPIEIRKIDRVTQAKQFEKEFVLFPWKIYRDKNFEATPWKKAWCPPIIIDHMDRFNPGFNISLKRLELQAFIAYRDGESVGRITAQINHGHLEAFHDDCGFFGYFECIEDYDVAKALFDTAVAWVKEKGMKKIRGPFNFSINDDWGWKCDNGPDFPANYETMPMVYQPHNPPYYNDFAVKYGMVKAQDHVAYHISAEKGLSDKMVRVADYIEKRAAKSMGAITYRHGNLKDWDNEVNLVKEIHDAAWVENWGTIRFTDEELNHAAKDLKMAILPKLIWFVFVKGEVAGFIMGLPDINQLQTKINGRLFPFGLFKLIWGLKVRPKFTRGRCVFLGMKPKFQGKGLEAPLIVKLFSQAKPMGITDIELSWILESNHKMRSEVEPFSTGVWMNYRAYDKAI